MNQDREKFQFPFKLILFQWKMPIVTFLSLVALAAFAMTKFHPQKTFFGKEYNYMYSLENSMRNGSKMKAPTVENKLLSFVNLRPLFDDLFIEAYLEESNIEKVDQLLKEIYQRLPVEDVVVKDFTLGSLGIEQKEFESAYEKCLTLLERENLSVDYPALYAYTLYRVLLLEDTLEHKEKALLTKEKLMSYIKEKKDTGKINSKVFRAIDAKLTKST